MTKNMGTIDRVIRILLAMVVAVLYFTDKISGALAIVLGIVAIGFLLSSCVGVCPGYLPFRFSTRQPPAGE